jgi:O-antigen ligase/Flp pilus assembly protein TadD
VARRRRVQRTEVDPAAEAAFIERLRLDPLFIATQIVFALKIVLVVLIFDPNVIDAFSLVKSATSHAMSLVLAVLLVGLLVVHGRRVLVWSPAHLAVGALVLVSALASVFALDTVTAFFGFWRRYLGMAQLLDGVLLYVAATILLATIKDLVRLAIACLATAGVVALYMFVQKAGLDPVTYTTGRAIAPPGTFGQPDVSGSYIAIAGITALAIALWVDRLPSRIALTGLSLACFAAAIFTNIRGGMIGLGFGWLAALALILLWPDRSRRRQGLLVLGGAAVIAFIGIVATPVGQRFAALFDLLSDRSAQSRLETWSAALQLVARRPLLGLGPDNFGVGYPPVSSKQELIANGGETQTSTHNWLLHVLTSSGIAGEVALLALLAVVVVLAVRLARRGHPAALALVPLAAFFGQGLVTINDMGTDWIPWLLCGVVAGFSGQRLVSRERVASPRWVSATLGVVAVAVLAVGVFAASERVSASDHFGQSEALVATNGFQALPHAIAAVQKDPRRAEYWSGLGAALNATNKVVAASEAFSEAARLKPTGTVFWSNLALMRLLLQDVHGASLALDRANAADPWDAQSRDLTARVALLLNDPARASREGHLAAELRPTDPGVYEAATAADIRLGKPESAEAMLRRGLTMIEPPASLPLHLLLAQVLHAEKRDAEARAEVAAALSIDPTNPAALQLQQDYK